MQDLTLAVGDHVVYGSYGIATVAAGERGRARGQAKVVVLEFADGLSVTLPVERAVSYLRPVSGEAEVSAVQTALRASESPAEEPWQKRIKAARSKLVEGEATGLAEVIRDGAHRAGKSTPRGEAVRLSANERDLCLKARRLLAAEIGLARGIEPDEADAWIGDQLAYVHQPRGST
jgi:RNA polymerase-interacting CarD/CdnL/TRCF family regulator